ncbi:MAG: hypothetical protein RIF33_05125 [Cyclobacteriaceae bacterium]
MFPIQYALINIADYVTSFVLAGIRMIKYHKDDWTSIQIDKYMRKSL